MHACTYRHKLNSLRTRALVSSVLPAACSTPQYNRTLHPPLLGRLPVSESVTMISLHIARLRSMSDRQRCPSAGAMTASVE